VLRERGAAGRHHRRGARPHAGTRALGHYTFPEGRNQLLTEALQYAGEPSPRYIDEAATNANDLVRQFVEFWEDMLVESDFRGLPR